MTSGFLFHGEINFRTSLSVTIRSMTAVHISVTIRSMTAVHIGCVSAPYHLSESAADNVMTGIIVYSVCLYKAKTVF